MEVLFGHVVRYGGGQVCKFYLKVREGENVSRLVYLPVHLVQPLNFFIANTYNGHSKP